MGFRVDGTEPVNELPAGGNRAHIPHGFTGIGHVVAQVAAATALPSKVVLETRRAIPEDLQRPAGDKSTLALSNAIGTHIQESKDIPENDATTAATQLRLQYGLLTF